MSQPAPAPRTLHERTQEISAEYWDVREGGQTERVAVAQLAIALAKAEAAQPQPSGALREALAAVMEQVCPGIKNKCGDRIHEEARAALAAAPASGLDPEVLARALWTVYDTSGAIAADDAAPLVAAEYARLLAAPAEGE